VVDRLIQQALHQVMSRVFEPGFSESSYGFALDAAPTTRC
jgi:RNA-directed DNA polymerase